tara:strand:+ start:924 stop:2066 length:1143 start_codon:yes stop_codon:yes gene_type:complete
MFTTSSFGGPAGLGASARGANSAATRTVANIADMERMREFDEKLQQRHDATQAATGRCITAFLMASTRQILLMFALLAPARSASIIPARLAEPPSEAAVRTFLSKVQPLPVVPGKQLTFEQVLKADGLSYYSKRLDTEDAKVLAYVVCVSTVLVKLYIGANSIGDAGAAALAEALKTNRMVKELSLNENSIGDVGAAALGEALLVNPVISVMSLAGNPSIGDKGAAAIAEALKTNTVLQQLHLFDCSIGDQGAMAIAEALRVNVALTHLIIEGNLIENDGATALARALRANAGLTTLHISENKISPQARSELQNVGVPVLPNAQDTGKENNAPKRRHLLREGHKPIASLRRLQRKKRRTGAPKPTDGKEASRKISLSLVY